jgi:hypothetical protein
MRVLMVAALWVGAACVLAGCGGSSAGSSTATTTAANTALRNQMASLPATSRMPTGTANYVGRFTASSASGATSRTEAGDAALAANFDTATVRGALSNYTATSVTGSVTEVLTTRGEVAGSGTISGARFTIPAMSGFFTTTSYTINGVAQTITNPINPAGTTDRLSGQFVGDNALGIYGTGTLGGSSFEIYGAKK